MITVEQSRFKLHKIGGSNVQQISYSINVFHKILYITSKTEMLL
jgi:hypothetical protein